MIAEENQELLQEEVEKKKKVFVIRRVTVCRLTQGSKLRPIRSQMRLTFHPLQLKIMV